MTRLQSELQRLYRLDDADAASGQVRALGLALGRPADWEALSKVWQGVQGDLALPAPAIAVSGIDGYQIWFSLAQAWPLDQATAFLDSVRARYLRDIEAHRIDLMLEAPKVPAVQAQAGQWSAFVAPDLAPVFADTPWLDIPPSPDGQADLLSRLESIQHNDFQRALDRLQPAPPAATSAAQDGLTNTPSPKTFLLQVMNDDTVEMRLRIEAAKALLPYA